MPIHAGLNESDSLRIVDLEGVTVVSSPKESGLMRQQPTAVSLITQKQMSDNHITSLKGVSAMVPNYYMPDYGSRLTSAIYIRGVGSRINTPAVGLYVDNIPYVDKSAFDFNYYDIERIDIMRGPQGTLYGRNTMAGLVKVHTRNPLTYHGTDLKMSLNSGDYHRSIGIFHYARPTDKYAHSLSAYAEGGTEGKTSPEGYRSEWGGMSSVGGRYRGIYLPTSKLTMDFSISGDYSDEGAYPYYYTGTTIGNEEFADLIGHISNNRRNSYRRGLLNAGMNIKYDTGTWEMNATTGYQYLNDRMFLDQDFLRTEIYTMEQRQRINTLTEEITFRNHRQDGNPWEWLTGINLMYQSLHTDGPVTFYNNGLRFLEKNINANMPSIDDISMLKMMGFEGMSINFRGETLAMDGDYDTPTLGAALFHQSTFHIGNHLSAIAGLRLDYEHLKMKYFSPAHVEYGFRMPNPRGIMNVDLQNMVADVLYDGMLKDDYLKLLPKFAVKYEINNDNNIYASASMGTRSGGYNVQMFSDLLQGSMRVDMMEGVKQGVVGYLRELSQKNPAMPAMVVDRVGAIMEENMPVFERPTTSQVTYQPEYTWNYEMGAHLMTSNRQLSADAAVFFMDTRNQQIARFADSGLGRQMVNAGHSQSYGAEVSVRYLPIEHLSLMANYGYTHSTFKEYDDGQGINYDGNYVPYVPMHTVNADAAYTIDINRGKLNDITIGIGYTGAGKVYWTEDNTASQNFYSLLNARIISSWAWGNINVWCKNLTDTKYNTFYFISASRGFEQHGKPLQVGVDVTVRL